MTNPILQEHSNKVPSNKVSSELIQELTELGTRLTIAAGQRFIAEGERGEGVYLLHSGSVRMIVSPRVGERVALRTLGPGSFLGLSATLTCDHYGYTVEAVEASEATFVPAAATQEFLRSRPDLCLEMIQLLGQEMSSLCNERAQANSRRVGIAGGKA